MGGGHAVVVVVDCALDSEVEVENETIETETEIETEGSARMMYAICRGRMYMSFSCRVRERWHTS